MSWLILLHQFLLFLSFSQVLTRLSSRSSSTSARPTCLEDQRFALLQFKKTFVTSGFTFLQCISYSHPKMEFWNESTDCCSWEGVIYDWLNGHVIRLDLSCRELQGTIQSNSSLFHLRQLQRLNLAFNDFKFSIISSKSNSFRNLRVSKLTSLDFSGIHEERLEQHTFNMLLQNLIQLRELHLDALDISSPLPHAFGQIPLSISNLVKFTHLFLSNNNLNRQIPDSIGNMSQLAFLDLCGNQLTGPIPLYAIGLSRLAYLDFKNNSLNGTIPSWLFTLPSLVSIELSGNKLQEQIPGSVYEPANLTHSSFSSNNLSGIVELDKLLRLKYLSHLDLSHNGLSLSINNSVNFTMPKFYTIGLASCKRISKLLESTG
ncbi:hypothetical protein ACSBR1_011301 [Camellia fascicularis]